MPPALCMQHNNRREWKIVQPRNKQNKSTKWVQKYSQLTADIETNTTLDVSSRHAERATLLWQPQGTSVDNCEVGCSLLSNIRNGPIFRTRCNSDLASATRFNFLYVDASQCIQLQLQLQEITIVMLHTPGAVNRWAFRPTQVMKFPLRLNYLVHSHTRKPDTRFRLKISLFLLLVFLSLRHFLEKVDLFPN